MKLIEALRQQGVGGPPLPINAGRCEAPADGYPHWVVCGSRGRWLVSGHVRCGKHKDKP